MIIRITDFDDVESRNALIKRSRIKAEIGADGIGIIVQRRSELAGFLRIDVSQADHAESRMISRHADRCASNGIQRPSCHSIAHID